VNTPPLGEQYSRAANVLTAITGNVGIPGGYAAGFMRAYSSRASHQGGGRSPGNPVEAGAPPRKDSLHKLRGGTNPNSARIHYNKVFDAILRGRAGGYPADIKMVYISAGNLINQHSNTRRGAQALLSPGLEFVVVQDQFMTPTARLADIVLPVNTFMERADIAPPWLGSPYYIYLNKAVDSPDETRSDVQIGRELAAKLGFPNLFGEASEDDMLRGIASRRDDIGDYDAMKRDGVVKIRGLEPTISFREQIEDPEGHPFPTASGKIEIYSEHLEEIDDPLVPPIPRYISPREGYDDPLADRYPLQLMTPHPKRGTHSSLHMVPWLREVERQAVWISTADAAARGIGHSDLVDVFNDRGRMRIPAKVTERIMPGVVCVCQGSWYDPDEDGVDRGGCANVLTLDDRSPGGATTTNTALVQVEPAPEDRGGAR
jgi:anaerobic dimethyl sulfoxide reductase subunit A